jgi:hypothetical protein
VKMLVPQRDCLPRQSIQPLGHYRESTCATTHYDPAHNSDHASKLTHVAAPLAVTCINSIVDGSQLTRMRPDKASELR